MHFGQIKAGSLVLVNEEGVPMEPTEYKINTAGFIIHSAIHKARPDINAACHVHSMYGRAWSAFGKPIEMLNQGKTLIQHILDDRVRQQKEIADSSRLLSFLQ